MEATSSNALSTNSAVSSHCLHIHNEYNFLSRSKLIFLPLWSIHDSSISGVPSPSPVVLLPSVSSRDRASGPWFLPPAPCTILNSNLNQRNCKRTNLPMAPTRIRMYFNVSCSVQMVNSWSKYGGNNITTQTPAKHSRFIVLLFCFAAFSVLHQFLNGHFVLSGCSWNKTQLTYILPAFVSGVKRGLVPDKASAGADSSLSGNVVSASCIYNEKGRTSFFSPF